MIADASCVWYLPGTSTIQVVHTYVQQRTGYKKAINKMMIDDIYLFRVGSSV